MGVLQENSSKVKMENFETVNDSPAIVDEKDRKAEQEPVINLSTGETSKYIPSYRLREHYCKPVNRYKGKVEQIYSLPYMHSSVGSFVFARKNHVENKEYIKHDHEMLHIPGSKLSGTEIKVDIPKVDAIHHDPSDNEVHVNIKYDRDMLLHITVSGLNANRIKLNIEPPSPDPLEHQKIITYERDTLLQIARSKLSYRATKVNIPELVDENPTFDEETGLKKILPKETVYGVLRPPDNGPYGPRHYKPVRNIARFNPADMEDALLRDRNDKFPPRFRRFTTQCNPERRVTFQLPPDYWNNNQTEEYENQIRMMRQLL